MKKVTLIISLLTFCLILTACGSTNQTISEASGAAIENTSFDVDDESEATNTAEGLNIEYVNYSQNGRYVPTSADAQSITEEECESLAYDIHDEVLAIAQEFYGFPMFLRRQPGKYSLAGDPIYTEVYVNPAPSEKAAVEFENNVEFLENIVDEYFTDALIDLAFSLEYPCPIYEENGVLYRTIYEEGSGVKYTDLSAGRILSREDGIVRYGFPIYSADVETCVTKKDFWVLGYMDFVYEDEAWKVNDFRLSGVAYSYNYFPGGTAPIRMDDFFETTDGLESENVTVNLDSGTVSCVVGDKTVTAELNINSSKVRNIERIGGNVFISFLGALNETETLVISEEGGAILSQFISNGYCADENGNWYYVVIDCEKLRGDIFDKEDKPLRNFIAVKQDTYEYRALPMIAPIDEISFDGEIFTITYDVTAY